MQTQEMAGRQGAGRGAPEPLGAPLLPAIKLSVTSSDALHPEKLSWQSLTLSFTH